MFCLNIYNAEISSINHTYSFSEWNKASVRQTFVMSEKLFEKESSNNKQVSVGKMVKMLF